MEVIQVIQTFQIIVNGSVIEFNGEFKAQAASAHIKLKVDKEAFMNILELFDKQLKFNWYYPLAQVTAYIICRLVAC